MDLSLIHILQDGKITDENRLVAALPTIKKLVADGGKIIPVSYTHLFCEQ